MNGHEIEERRVASVAPFLCVENMMNDGIQRL